MVKGQFCNSKVPIILQANFMKFDNCNHNAHTRRTQQNPYEQIEHTFGSPKLLGIFFVQTKYLNHPNTMSTHTYSFVKRVAHEILMFFIIPLIIDLCM
jgi:hypothetical protein